jgi:hypothetical protein
MAANDRYRLAFERPRKSANIFPLPGLHGPVTVWSFQRERRRRTHEFATRMKTSASAQLIRMTRPLRTRPGNSARAADHGLQLQSASNGRRQFTYG